MNKTIIKILNKLNALKYFRFKSDILINKKHFIIPIWGRTGYSNLSTHEPWMIDLLKLIIPIDAYKFIDVGMNIGQTLLKQKSISPKMFYIGFEPNPICFHYVNQLVATNKLRNCEIIPVGISSRTEIGVLNYFNPTTDDGSASIIDNFRPTEQIFKKEYVPLFDCSNIKTKINLSQISILKIDVEGSELDVIKGFKQEIEQWRPIIIVEILPTYSKKMVERINRQNQLQSILSALSYTTFKVIINNNNLINFQEIKEIGIHSDLNQCEYVFIPQLKKEQFKNKLKEWLSAKLL